MSKELQTALTFAVYVLLAAATVAAYKFAFIDSTLETVLLTGTLYHLGLSYNPTMTGGIKNDSHP